MSERITDDSLQMLLEHSRELQKYKAIGSVEEFAAAKAELQRWHTSHCNNEIESLFANMSTLCCHNCDHKDDYIIDLEFALAKYKQAEAEGRLVALPCKVGDTVYKIAQGLSLYKGVIPFVTENAARSASKILKWIEDGSFGKTVFLTRKEAEAALAAEKESSHETY